MQESSSKYAVGLDIGTQTVRCVIGHIDGSTGIPKIVGVGSSANRGMRKGIVVNLDGPAQAIDDALGEAERMSGYQVDAATISINGYHVMSTHTDGMIAVGNTSHEITSDDLSRIEEVATLGKIPANREVLDVIPHSYKLDGQDNIKNPIGMTGNRLEVDAHVLSVLSPYMINLEKTADSAKVLPHSIIVAGVAAAKAVLSEVQIENGVALVDIGGSTTNVAVYEEGDLRFAAVIPMGGINITNDLAIGLKIDPEIAEIIKVEHASLDQDVAGEVSIKHKNEIYTFDKSEIQDIITARLEEILEAVNKELKRAGRAGKLPNGVVMTGGTAQLKGLAEYSKNILGLAVKIGRPGGYGGVVEGMDNPQYATVIGLMLIDSASDKHGSGGSKRHNRTPSGGLVNRITSIVSGFTNRFRP